jgi:ammonia channel protein AmtB
MAKNPNETLASNSVPGGLLGALGLSPRLLLLVALLTLMVWWYFQNQGMALTPTETAVVVLVLAVAAAAGRAALSLVRRLRAPARGKQGGTAE